MPWGQFLAQVRAVSAEFDAKLVTPVTLPPGRLMLATSPSADRIGYRREDDGNCAGCLFGRKRRRSYG